MAQYAHHPQHYLSTQPSHRLLAYKPPPPPPQPQSFIPTTSATNVATKRARSPSSSHIYSSPSSKSSRSSHVSQMHPRPPSPGSTYPPSSSQVARNGAPGSAVGYSSPQTQSAFSAYLNYMSPSSASYTNQMPRVRGPSQMSNYINPLTFLPQPIVDPKQQQANVYSHHQMLMSSKNGSIMNGYPLQPQQ